MVKFFCLLNNRHYHSSKESVQQSVITMQEAYVVCDQPRKVVCVESNSKTLLLKAYNDNSSNTSAEKISSSSSVEQCWKSEEMMINFSDQKNMEVDLKGSQSVGSGLDSEGKNSSYIKTEDEKDQGLSYDDSQDNNYERMSEAYDHNELMESLNRKDPRDDILQRYDEALVVDKMYTEAILAVRDLEKLEKEEYEESTTFITSDHSSDARDYMPGTPPLVSKSCSSDMGISSFVLSRGDSSSHVNIEPQSRSSEDGGNLDARRKVIQTDKLGLYVMEDEERDKISKSEKDNSENLLCERFDSDNVIGSVKDLVTPKMGEIDMTKNLQGDSSVQRNDKLPSREFKIKRIEEWISMIDLEDSAPLLDEIESPQAPIELTRDSKLLRSLSAAKLDAKPPNGIEVAKHYISSLTAISATAQLANHGLVVMPLLSAFVSLKVLNLSGNSIVRITSGALPRGLHMLNLSKNNISTIEGLRELTRLRVLDLSHNRISRIGHGLAYCSAIKELYLAGNKISEVEGLQRLLKLKILDLHFNKISTAKCFGQLVANYSSLQSISVEGNPAQKNVGDEQVKKFLQSILPNLACYNKQSTRSGSSKEHIDRTSRSAIATSNQSYRGLRSEHKLNPKGSQKLAIHKPSSSARHG